MDPALAPPPLIARLRQWLRSDMRTLRWVFLGLYVALIVGLLGLAAVDGDFEALAFLMICLGVFFGAQAMLILGAGTIQLCRPLRKRRLLLPVLAASFMFTVLVFGMALAMTELFKLEDVLGSDFAAAVVFGLVPLSWIVWGVLLFTYAQNWQRYSVLSRFARMLFAGSLLELLATVPAHVIVIRRPGCLVGLSTMLGIVAGLGVMFFSFGPMIVVLFLRPRYRAEKAMGTQFCTTCGYDLRASNERCPECGTPFLRSVAPLNLDPHQV